MNEKETISKIRRAALNLLARRDYSSHELNKKLTSRGFVFNEIQTVIVSLIQSGLLNEQRFIENFICSRRRRGYGPQHIIQALQEHSISHEMIAEHLQITDNAWFIEVRKVWQKHFKGILPTDFRERAKQMRFLHYRGFTREQINSVFRVEDNE